MKIQRIPAMTKPINVFRILAILWIIPVSQAHGEPSAQTRISFSVQFDATYDDAAGREPARLAIGPSLTGSFEPGLVVSLIDKAQVCKAKTGRKFRYPISGGGDLEATVLKDFQGCTPAPVDSGSDSSEVQIAVVGIDPSAIRIIKPSNDKSPVPKEVELQAREHVKSDDVLVEQQWPISNAPPKVTRVGSVTLLEFGCVTAEPDKIFFFSNVLILNGKLFPLEDRCTRDHFFFTLNGKLHLCYLSACCGCCWRVTVVYDISSSTPKKMFESTDLQILF